MNFLLAALLAALDQSGCIAPDEENWTVTNYEKHLVCEVGRVFRGSRCLYVGGPTGACVTAVKFDSRRIAVPEGMKSVEISFEVYSEKWLNGLYQDKWDAKNAVAWYDSAGKETVSRFRLYLPRGNFSRVIVRKSVPVNARCFELRIAREMPKMTPGETFAIRDVRYAFSGEEMTGGAYDVEAVPMPLGPAEARTVKIAKPTPRQDITLRKDGMAVVNGEPFFPIGMLGARARPAEGMSLDDVFAELRDNGFNLAYCYIQQFQYQTYLDAAEKTGMRLLTRTRPPDTQMIEKGRFSPTILAWYIGDDTCDFLMPEELLSNNATLKKIDPYRLTTQADGYGDLDILDYSRYADYVNGTDVFMPEIYPTYDQAGVDVMKPGMGEAEWNARCVAEVVREMEHIRSDVRRFGDGSPRACWPILQVYAGWGNARYPTGAELRAMAFAAIIHGANGVLWFTYVGFNGAKNKGAVDDPEKWAQLKAISRELSGYGEILLQDNRACPSVEVVGGPATDVFGSPSVTCLLKRRDDEVWLFAVNATKSAVTACIHVEQVDRPEIKEEFEPFGVRVYRLRTR